MQVAVIIDVAFIVAVFFFVSLVRPDLHIEGGRSLLEFRDPLSLMPRQKILVPMKIWNRVNGNVSRFRWSEGERIEDQDLLASKICLTLPRKAEEPHWKIRPGTRRNQELLQDCLQPNG